MEFGVSFHSLCLATSTLMTQMRPLAQADLEHVLAITAASPEAASWSRQTYEAILQHQQHGCCYVAEVGGLAVGFVCFRVASDEAELLNLAVLPSSRRQGIGSRLLEQTLREAASRGATRIFLEVRETNQPALKFYQRYSFTVSTRRGGYYSNPPADALVLARNLA